MIFSVLFLKTIVHNVAFQMFYYAKDSKNGVKCINLAISLMQNIGPKKKSKNRSNYYSLQSYNIIV